MLFVAYAYMYVCSRLAGVERERKREKKQGVDISNEIKQNRYTTPLPQQQQQQQKTTMNDEHAENERK